MTRIQKGAIAAALTLYAVLLAFMVPRHEPWADEAQSWVMASHSGLYDLFRTNIHYEVSPGLWHLLLWLLAKLHVSYSGIHWVSAAFAFAAMYLLLRESPFPLWLRLLLPFTYYFSFQYALVARSYVLYAPILFGLAYFWRQRQERPLPVALLAGLLANVSAHGFMVALGLTMVLIIEACREGNPTRSRSRDWLLAGLMLCFFLAFACWCLLPPPDADWLSGARTMTSTAAQGAFPQNISYGHSWQSHFPPLVQVALWLCRRFGGALWRSMSPVRAIGVVAWLALLWRWQREHLLRYAIPVVLLGAFGAITRFNVYHAGLVWVLFLFLWWITWPVQSNHWPETLILCTVALCIAFQIHWAAQSMRYDFAQSYSPDRDTAPFLKAYIDAGRQVDLAIPPREGIPQHGEFFAVGLEPYFPSEPLSNMRARFWIWRDDSDMRDQYLRDTAARSAVVLLEQTNDDTRVPAEDARLRSLGYNKKKSICGRAFYPWGTSNELCHVFYEPLLKESPGL